MPFPRARRLLLPTLLVATTGGHDWPEVERGGLQMPCNASLSSLTHTPGVPIRAGGDFNYRAPAQRWNASHVHT